MLLKNKNKLILKKASTNEEDTQTISLDFILSGIDLENRTIEIRADITEQSASIITRALMSMSRISHEPITIYLSSTGGDVYQGMAIYDFIRACPCDIHIIGSGQIMSMGFMIYLAGDVRTAMPHTTFMMHSLSYSPGETPKIVRNHEIDVLEAKRMNNRMLDVMGERTNRNKKYWYRTVLLLDKHYSVDEAKEVGIIKDSLKVVTKKPVVKKGKKNVRK